MAEDNELDSEPDFHNTQEDDIRRYPDGEPFPILSVWVNAGYGQRSHPCIIQPNGMMTLPDAIVRELNMKADEEINLELDEEEGIIYVRKVSRSWNKPDWLDIDEE
jgi:hypothetical protein